MSPTPSVTRIAWRAGSGGVALSRVSGGGPGSVLGHASRVLAGRVGGLCAEASLPAICAEPLDSLSYVLSW